MDELNISKEVKELSAELFSSETAPLLKKQIAIDLVDNIRYYLYNLDIIGKMAAAQLDKDFLASPNLSEEYKHYIYAKDMIKLNPQIESLLQEGYTIINTLRETFTGEIIKYRIGVEFKGKLYEGFLTMSDIINMSKATPEWKGPIESLYKLRLSGMNKSDLISKMTEISISEIQKANEDHSTLYSSIRSYASANKIYNQGNVYEAYRVLKERYRSNEIPPAKWIPSEFDTVLSEVRKNTASYVKGGDIFNEQIKFFGKNVPSLTSINTIRTTLQIFNKMLISLSGSDLEYGLKQLFLKQEQLELSGNEVSEEIENIINDLLKGFK